MAKSSKLRVMLSSRCNDKFTAGAATTLTDIRKDLKKDIEGMEIAGRQAFEVWMKSQTHKEGRGIHGMCASRPLGTATSCLLSATETQVGLTVQAPSASAMPK